MPGRQPNPSSIGLHITFEHGTPILHVTGEIDLANVELLHDAVASIIDSERFVIVDLAGVEFIDLRGLEQGLVGPLRQSKNQGAAISIRNPPRTVRRILDETQLGQLFS
jgi:anti-anti-sigma factor